MIRIAGNILDRSMFANELFPDSVELMVVDILSSSSTIYDYDSIEQLKFELSTRGKTVDAARDLDGSGFGFTTFRKSRCNSQYWTRTDEGGFLLKNNVAPYEGILDIFKNSDKYGTECATAMVIVFYKALVDVLPQNLFNSLFADIYLMNWSGLDKDLDLADYRELRDYLPGDCRYFKNPDVNPLTPEWQGENAIELGNGMYYGHGIGIKTAKEIIEALNENRKSDADESAYLLNSALRPNFRYLFSQYKNYQRLNNI